MKKLQNYGVQELDNLDIANINGGRNFLGDWLIGKAIDYAIGGAIWVMNNQPSGYINTHMQ